MVVVDLVDNLGIIGKLKNGVGIELHHNVCEYVVESKGLSTQP